jgi:hypothetical protein
MAGNLIVPYLVPNWARLVFSRIKPDEDAKELTFDCSLRTGTGGAVNPKDAEISTVRMTISAGVGDIVSRATIPDGGQLSAALRITGTLVIASAFDNAWAAFKTSRAAFEAHLLATGYVDASLAYT